MQSQRFRIRLAISSTKQPKKWSKARSKSASMLIILKQLLKKEVSDCLQKTHRQEVAVSLKTEEGDQMKGEAKSLSLTHSRKILRLVDFHSGIKVIELHDMAKASLTCCIWLVHQAMVIPSRYRTQYRSITMSTLR